MSRNVEENVVKMSFDNKDFDRNIRESQQSLDGFQNSLGSLNKQVLSMPSDIASQMTKILRGVNLSNFINIADTLGVIDTLKSGISSIGDTIESVADFALNKVKSTMTAAIAQIESGGKTRALNIQQAKFQIEGLGMDVETFMTAADYAVSGTAYSLDAAARAAAQLGASGVTSLEKLKYSLRGISGVAAMTNSSYEDIAHIFTTIAGMGKVTNQYLDSIAIKGLNARAKLGEQLGKTEAEIRDMVSKGQVDFDTFAKAMDEAFGEHSKEANKTFSGVMSNIRAALSKIGEGIYTPLYSDTLEFLEQIRLLINEFKTSLADNYVFSSWAEGVKSVSSSLKGLVENIRTALKESSFMEELSYLLGDVFNIVTNVLNAIFSSNYTGMFVQIGNDLGILINKIKQIIWAAKEAFDEIFNITHLGGSLHSFILYFFNLFEVFDEIDDRDVKDVFVSWFTALKNILDVIKDILGINKENFGNLFKGAVTSVYEFFKNLKLSDEEIDKLKRTFSGLASAIDIVKMLAVQIFNTIKPLFNYVRPLIDLILFGTSKVGDFLTNLRNTIKDDKIFENVFDKIAKVITTISGAAQNATEAASNKDGIFAKILAFVTSIVNFIKKFFAKEKEASDSFNKEAKVNESSGKTGIFSTIFNYIKKVIWGINSFGNDTNTTKIGSKNILETVIDFIGKIVDFVKKFFNKEEEASDVFNKKSSAKKATNGGANGGGVLENIFSYVKKAVNYVLDFINKIIDSINKIDPKIIIAVSATLITIIGAVTILLQTFMVCLTVFLSIAVVAGTIRKTLADLAKAFSFDNKLDALMKTIKGSVNSITETFSPDNLSKIIGGKDTVTSVLKAIKDLILSIAGSLFVLSLIPVGDIMQSLASTGAILAMIGAFILFLGILTKQIPQLVGVTKNLNNSSFDKYRFGKGESASSESRSSEYTKTDSPLSGFTMLIQSIALGILEMSAAVYILRKAGNTGQILSAVGGLIIMLAAISGMIFGMSELINKTTITKSDLLVSALAVKVMTLAIIDIAASLALLTSMKNPVGLIVVAATISIFLAVIGAIVVAMGKLLDGKSSLYALAGAASIMLILIGFMTTLSSLAKIIKQLGKIDDINTLEKTIKGIIDFLIAIGVIISVLTLIGGLVGAFGQGMGVLGIVSLISPLLGAAVLVLSMAPLIGPALLVAKSLADMYKELFAILDMLKGMDSAEISKLASNASIVFSAVFFSVFTAWNNQTLKNNASKGIDNFLEFVGDTIIPALGKFVEKIIPEITKFILLAIAEIYIFMERCDDEILSKLVYWLGTLLYPAVEAIMEVIGGILDTVTENISVVTDKLSNLILAFLDCVNKELDEHKEDILKMITHLVSFVISVITLSLLAEENLIKIYYAGMSIVSVLMQGIAKFAVPLADLFADMAKFAIAAFFAEFITAGLFDSENWFHQLFDGRFDDTFKIDFDVDMSNVDEKYNEMRNMFSNGTYDYTGVYGSNNAAVAKAQTRGLNMQEFKDQLVEGLNLKEIMSDLKLDTNVKLEFEPNAYGMMNILDQESSLQNAGGWDYAY